MYEAQQVFLGDEFLKEFYVLALEKIHSNSKAFRKYLKNGSIRRYKMRRFPYKIFYDDRIIPIKIIAVIHTSRSSDYLKRRLK